MFTEKGVLGFSTHNYRVNTPTHFTDHQTLFTVFGVFFCNFIGVLSGVNMAADLREPNVNIPIGELSAIGCSSIFCFLFIMILGGTCTRSALLTNSLIAEQVSATRVLFLAGFYISSFRHVVCLSPPVHPYMFAVPSLAVYMDHRVCCKASPLKMSFLS
jgi:amino acid transporter